MSKFLVKETASSHYQNLLFEFTLIPVFLSLLWHESCIKMTQNLIYVFCVLFSKEKSKKNVNIIHPTGVNYYIVVLVFGLNSTSEAQYAFSKEKA